MSGGPVLLEGPTVEAVEPAAERPPVVVLEDRRPPRLGGAALGLMLAAATLTAGMPPGLFGGHLAGLGSRRAQPRRGATSADHEAIAAAEAKRARKAARRRRDSV